MARRPAWYDRLEAEILPAARRFPALTSNTVYRGTLEEFAELRERYERNLP